MRIRSIRPEFWTSEDIAQLDWNTRLIFIGLWSYVDDNGVGRDVPKLIKADLFALEEDPHGALMQVTGALMQLADAKLITRYRVDRRPYLHITTWDTHQRISRPSANRYPLPTCENVDPPANDMRAHADYMSPHADVPLGEGEKGRRGEGEKSPSSAVASATPDQERPDVETLCKRLAAGVEGNGSKKPTITQKWRDSARLMLDRDERTYDQIVYLIDWSQNDEFWRSNIQSMPKLREKFDALRLKATARPGTDRQADILRAEMRRAQEADATPTMKELGP